MKNLLDRKRKDKSNKSSLRAPGVLIKGKRFVLSLSLSLLTKTSSRVSFLTSISLYNYRPQVRTTITKSSSSSKDLKEEEEDTVVTKKMSTMTLPPSPPPSSNSTEKKAPTLEKKSSLVLSEEAYKFNKFKKNFFEKDTVNLTKLSQAAWNGVPYQFRAISWMIMLGYVPVNRNRRKQCLKRRRDDYARFVEKYFDAPEGERSVHEQETLRQVLVDVPRTQPDSPLFAQKPIRRMLERILYVWALRRTFSSLVPFNSITYYTQIL